MKKGILVCLVFLLGCNASWVRTPAPAEPLSMQTAAIANGILTPQQVAFTLISQYQPTGQARVIVLTEPALKLADLTVSDKKIQVHYQAPKVPNKLISAWAELVRAQFLVACPARHMVHKTTALHGTFELDVTGGICL